MKLLVFLSCSLIFLVIAQTEPAHGHGMLQVLTGPRSEFDYLLTLTVETNLLTSVPKATSDAVISHSRHFNERSLEWRYDTYLYLALLLDTAVQFYSWQTDRWLLHETIPLKTTSHMQLTCHEEVDHLLVVHANNTGYSQLYIQELVVLPGSDRAIPLSCVDGQDLEATIENGAVRVSSVNSDYTSTILPAAIGECHVITKLHPLSRAETRLVFFTVFCLTAVGEEKHYYVSYPYTDAFPIPTAHMIPVGRPLDHHIWLAVISDRLLTMYDVTSWETLPPGISPFPSPIMDAGFHGDDLLSLSMDNTPFYIVRNQKFVKTRGREGVSLLSETNVGSCDPTCPPIVYYNGSLAAGSYDEESDSYSVIFYNSDSLTIKWAGSVTNIPDKPYGIVNINSLAGKTMYPGDVVVRTDVATIVSLIIAAIVVVLIITISVSLVVKCRPRLYGRIPSQPDDMPLVGLRQNEQNNQPANQPVDQPVNPPAVQPANPPVNPPAVQPANQPVNPPAVQPANQPVNPPAVQPANQPVNPPAVQPANQPVNPPAVQPANQPVNPPAVQPANQPVNPPAVQPANQPVNPPAVQPANPPVNPPAVQPVNPPPGQQVNQVADGEDVPVGIEEEGPAPIVEEGPAPVQVQGQVFRQETGDTEPSKMHFTPNT